MSQNTPVNVFDFTGLARAMCIFSAVGTTAAATIAFMTAAIYWNGTTLRINVLGNSLLFTAAVAGNVLTFQSAAAGTTSGYWSLQFLRTT